MGSYAPNEEGEIPKECNARLIEEVAEELNIPKEQVAEVVKHYASFTVGRIRSGSMEGVTFPYLGKFLVKFRSQQYKDYLQSVGLQMKKLINKSTTINILFEDDKEENE